MYEEFFGLKDKPFSLPPDPNYLFLSRQHRLALVHLTYGLDNKTGFIVVTGEIGTGKTLLIKRLIRGLSAKNVVATIFNTTVGPEEFLEMVMEEYELPYDGLSHAQKIERIHEFLINCYARRQNVILIIDEAQNLSLETLEEVRLISNLQTEKEFLLSIVLVGQPDLKKKLIDPRLRQLAQRVSVHFHLDPMTQAETKSYIMHRLQKAGAEDPFKIISTGAIELVYKYSNGVPRLINLLCDAALVNAFADQKRPVSEQHVLEVVNEGGGGGFWQLAVQEASTSDVSQAQREPAATSGNHLGERIEKLENEVREISQNLISLNKIVFDGLYTGASHGDSKEKELERVLNLLQQEREKNVQIQKERDELAKRLQELEATLRTSVANAHIDEPINREPKEHQGYESSLLKRLFKR